MKKITLITLDITQFGGTERAIQNFVEMFYSTYEIVIYSISSQPNDPLFFHFPKEVQIKHLNQDKIPVSAKKKIFWFPKVFGILKRNLKNSKTDFVLGMGHNVNFLLSLINISGTRIYGAEHIDLDTIPRVSKFLMAQTYSKLAGLVVLSEKARSKAVKLNPNIFIIPNVIHQETTDYENEAEQCANRIIMVGRISAEKGFDRVIPIAKYLQDFHPTWKIDIFGDGPLKDDLVSKFDLQNITNVRFCGATKNIKSEYKKSSIFMLTSYTEAMPMVILEAQSFGLPVIAYKNEGTELLIQNFVNGILAETHEEFCKGLGLLIENQNNIISKFKIESDEKLKEYSEKVIKSQWTLLIENQL